MRHKLLSFLSVAILVAAFLTLTSSASADNCGISANPATVEKDFKGDVILTGSGCFQQGIGYSVLYIKPGATVFKYFDDSGGADTNIKPASDGTLTFELNLDTDGRSKHEGDWTIIVCTHTQHDATKLDDCTDSNQDDVVGRTTIHSGGDQASTDYKVPVLDHFNQTACTFQIAPNPPVSLQATNLETGVEYDYWMVEDDHWHGNFVANSDTQSFEIDSGAFHDVGDKTICIDREDKDRHIEVGGTNCILLHFTAAPPDPDSTVCTDASITSAPPNPCPPEYLNSAGGCDAVDTAIGLIATTPEAFIERVFGIVLGLAGGIALLLIIYSGYELITSQGNQEKVQAARERLTAAIVGLLFIIFSLFILSVIGVDILHIPGFS